MRCSMPAGDVAVVTINVPSVSMVFLLLVGFHVTHWLL